MGKKSEKLEKIWRFSYSERCILWNQKVFVPLRGE